MHAPTAKELVVIERGLARSVMYVVAALVAFVSYAVLDSPLHVPLTVTLWLGATALMMLGMWGLPDEEEGRS